MSSSTTISFACEHCGRGFCVSQQQAGKRARCRTCGHEMRIPGPPQLDSSSALRSNGAERSDNAAVQLNSARAASSETYTFDCDSCGREYQVVARLRGKCVRCKSCGATIRIPGTPDARTATESSEHDIYGLDQPSAPVRPLSQPTAERADDLPSLDRSWMAPSAARDKTGATEPNGDGAAAIKMGLGMVGFGLIALVLPNFGLGLRMRGGKVLDSNETIFAGIFMIVVGVIVAGFGAIKSRMPARPARQKGSSRAFKIIVGVLGGFLLFLMALGAVSAMLGRR